MTIGIAAVGPRAGLAVFRALRAVERVGEGSLGGYAAFAAVARDHGVMRAQTQRGGTATLFVDAETTGVLPPPAIADAGVAGVMSSGPDRPEPLSQYVPAEDSGVLVTGHRLPNAPAASGRPLNLEILQRLASGEAADVAVDHVLGANPEADAGIIAVDLQGRIASANSQRVSQRSDLGTYALEDEFRGVRVAALCNGVRPAGALARLAVEIAVEVMAAYRQLTGTIEVRAETELEIGPHEGVHVDANGTVQRIVTTDGRLLEGTWNCAPVYRDAAVYMEGRLLGHVIEEANAVVRDGMIEHLNGTDRVSLRYNLGSQGTS